jgi:hypothetical protein
MKGYKPYCGGQFEEMQAEAKLDIPMGETWVVNGNDCSVNLAGIVGHTHGERIIAAEPYNGAPELPKPKFSKEGLIRLTNYNIIKLMVNRIVTMPFTAETIEHIKE